MVGVFFILALIGSGYFFSRVGQRDEETGRWLETATWKEHEGLELNTFYRGDSPDSKPLETVISLANQTGDYHLTIQHQNGHFRYERLGHMTPND